MTWNSQNYKGRWGELTEFYDYQNNKENKMFNWTKLKSALVSGVLTGVLGAVGYVLNVGDVFAIDVHALVNVLALGILTAVVSLIKSALTTDAGNFAGAVKVA